MPEAFRIIWKEEKKSMYILFYPLIAIIIRCRADSRWGPMVLDRSWSFISSGDDFLLCRHVRLSMIFLFSHGLPLPFFPFIFPDIMFSTSPPPFFCLIIYSVNNDSFSYGFKYPPFFTYFVFFLKTFPVCHLGSP